MTFAVSGVVEEVVTKLPIMANKGTPGTERTTSARLLMAMVETASAAAVETATATFLSTVKVATCGGCSH